MSKRLLLGHTSAETAFVQEDYPYSFKLRCQRRCWVETKAKHGQRMVTQTLNPKTGRWNQPKAGVYHSILVMYLVEETNHVERAAIGGYDSDEKLEAFATEYAAALVGDYEKQALLVARAMRRAAKKVTWSVVTGEEAKNVPSVEEQSKMLRGLVGAEIVAMKKEESEQ